MYIHSLGHFHPENIVDNRFLEDLDIGTDDQWIMDRTGIRARHTVLPLDYIRETRNKNPHAGDEASLYSNAETSSRAAAMAFQRAGVGPSQIGMVICGGCAPRIGTPAESCVIADRLGITAPSFDLNSACSSWGVQLHFLSMMDPNALPDFVLLVSPENLSRTVDYTDRSIAVLMGDCTTATIVSPRIPSPIRVRRTSMESDPSGWNKVTIPSAGHLRQDGGAVQNFAIRKSVATIEKLRGSSQPGFYFVGHQANLPMLRSACQRAGIDDEKHLYNVDMRGNCGAAGAPSIVSERFSCFKKGDQVLLAIVGSGLTWAGVLLDFEGSVRQ
jgi:3-oxoacyl-[acyl-carrier-protein] synthase-3